MGVHGGNWGWAKPMRGEHFRTCEYCGSIHPADLVSEPGWVAEWADQKYGYPHKFYVKIPNRDPGRLYCIGSGNLPLHDDFIRFEDLTPRQRLAVGNSGMRLMEGNSYKFGTKATHHAKFYSLHLADPELPRATKLVIETSCGVEFDFDGEAGRVRWRVTR